MCKHIKKYIKICNIYYRNKPNQYKSYRIFQPHNILYTPYKVITYNFIQSLLPAQNPLMNMLYNEILIIIDKLTKIVIFILWNN
jgi:hypothetical protein